MVSPLDGTEGSNPLSSSRESVSRPHPLSKVQNPGFMRGCARLAWRPQVRQLARQAWLADIRGDLLELAAKFERLAAYADAAIRLGVPGYPHGAVIASERDQPPPKERE
jgi:hypothetical protein